MNQYVNGNEFAECFPENFKTEILPEDAEPKNLLVYRVCISGKIDAKAFESTYESIFSLKRPNEEEKIDNNEDKSRNPSTYSTSCFTKKNQIRGSVKRFRRRENPNAIVAQGETGEEDGLVRGPSKHGHVDWWIYRNHDVSNRFHDVTEDVLSKKEENTNDKNT